MCSSDLTQHFSVTSCIEKRLVKCWVLKKTQSNVRFQSVGGEPECTFRTDKHGQTIIFRNEKMSFFLGRIFNDYLVSDSAAHLFINETGYRGAIDAELRWRNFDVKYSIFELQNSLRKLGLDLVMEYRMANVLVIRPDNGMQKKGDSATH